METWWLYAYLAVGVVWFILFCRYVISDDPMVEDYVLSPFVIIAWLPMLALFLMFIIIDTAFKLSKTEVKK